MVASPVKNNVICVDFSESFLLEDRFYFAGSKVLRNKCYYSSEKIHFDAVRSLVRSVDSAVSSTFTNYADFERKDMIFAVLSALRDAKKEHFHREWFDKAYDLASRTRDIRVSADFAEVSSDIFEISPQFMKHLDKLFGYNLNIHSTNEEKYASVLEHQNYGDRVSPSKLESAMGLVLARDAYDDKDACLMFAERQFGSK